MRGQLLFQAVTGKWAAAGQAFIQHTCQRINVRAGIGLTGAEPLRRHVAQGADHPAGRRQAGLAHRARDPKIDKIRKVVVVEQSVGRLDIPMHQSDLVRGMHCLGHLLDNQHRPGRIQRTVGQHLSQVAAVDQPHVDIEAAVDLAVIVDGDDVRVVQPGSGVRLPAEPLGEAGVLGQVRRKHLDRHDSVGRGVVGAPYFADAAAAQQLHQPVAPKRRPLHLISKQLWFSKP